MVGQTPSPQRKHLYKLYESAVQSPKYDVRFLRKTYKKLRGREAKVLREDFCGTGFTACEWVKSGKGLQAIGVDLDPKAIGMGEVSHYANLTDEQRDRMVYKKTNVLKASKYKADVVVAFNFSYFIFRERQLLLNYFKAVRKSLKTKGVFFMDVMGGSDSMMENKEEFKHDGFTYIWECKEFNPLNHECKYAIHFREGDRHHRNAFTYHWRHWTLPELKDLLLEAGFRDVVTYWEGDDGEGGGNGIYRPAKKVENCDLWIVYISATP